MSDLRAPFPYFGGKSRIAPRVWRAFGDVRNFVEPFFGSGACLLARPAPFVGTETVNDADGFVANFWRALQADPVSVAHAANWPVNENDLHARHSWLVGQRDTMQARLEGDPDFYDVRAAGWWAWGMSCWIGSGFCSGKGPWQVKEIAGVRQLVHLGDAGQGVNRQLVHLGDAGQGVNRQLVHLGDAGRGVNRQLVHLGSAGQGVNRKLVHLGDAGRGVNRKRVDDLAAYLRGLADRLARVRVCCGDWKRVCTETPTIRMGTTAVFLDPPYGTKAKLDMTLYRVESGTVAADVCEWARERGDDPRYRIAVCGYEGEHRFQRGWKCLPWKTSGGYSSQGSKGDVNRHRERIWFSPHCVRVSTREALAA